MTAVIFRRRSSTMRWALTALLVSSVALLPSVSQAQARRIAVLDFANAAKDPAVEALGPVIAETLTTKLQSVRVLELVERHRLYKLLQEEQLHQADLVDPSQAVHVGRLLGAERVVLGAYVKRGDRLRISVRFVDTATGAIVTARHVDGAYDPGEPSGFWAALDQLVQATIDALNTRVVVVQAGPVAIPVDPAERIAPTPEERARLANVPTRSLDAQDAYGRGLVHYRRGQYGEAAREFGRATSIDPDFVEAWVSLGAALGNLGHSTRAVPPIERAYRLYLTLGDEPAQATALGNIGVEHDRQGRHAEAIVYYERSLTLQEKLGNASGQASTLAAIGLAHEQQKHYAEALAAYERALKLQETLGNEAGQARTLESIAVVREGQGRYADALSYYERALRLQEKLGREPDQAITLNTIGILQDRQRRPIEALASFDRALKLGEKLGNEEGQAAALDNMAKVHRGEGDHARALTEYEGGLRLREKLGDEVGQARTLNNIGVIHAEQGRYVDALSAYERSLRLAVKLGEEPGQAFILSRIGNLHRAEGRVAEALSFYERAFDIADRLGRPERETYRRLRDQLRAPTSP